MSNATVDDFWGFSPLFIDSDGCCLPQLIFLTVVYGYILYNSSGLIAEGSELLLLFPSVAGLVGSVVLPILGAVPDGVMVLFSGIGPDAQNQVSVGVGALAGSTVMLLTLPWFLAIMSGKVPVVDGKAMYGKENNDTNKKLAAGAEGVEYQGEVKAAAKIMIATTLLYLVIQIPATMEENITAGMGKDDQIPEQAQRENTYALVGLILCSICFIGYLIICVKAANGDKELEAIIEAIKKKEISVKAALSFVKDKSKRDVLEEKLIDKKAQGQLKKIVRPFFAQFDQDKSGKLDVTEFSLLLNELGEKVSAKEVSAKFADNDKDKSGTLEFSEVVEMLETYLLETDLREPEKFERIVPKYNKDDDDEEEEEMPEDLQELSPKEQLRRVLFRSIWMMGLGTFMVLLFSDPMVDVLSMWGDKTGVPPFYISFILAPLASNASELLSAYTYAAKKSSKSITTALSTLVGAAIMNNTFCLAIFFGLIYVKKLAWQFTAETVAIIAIQWVIGLMTMVLKVQVKFHAILIMACYPGCLLIVWVLENLAGLD